MIKLALRNVPIFICTLITIFLFSAPITGNAGSTQRPYTIKGVKYYPIPSSIGYKETGKASWYGKYFHGRLTSNGEKYDMYSMTAAHKTLPMQTKLLVTNLENGKRTIVRVNDRGPFVSGRIIDLSFSAAKEIGMDHAGVMKVKIEAISDSQLTKNSSGHLKYRDINRGDFYIQIGTYAKKYYASKLESKFKKYGHITSLTTNTSGKKTLYRVYVYAGHSLKKARLFEKRLIEKGYKGAFVIAL